MTLFKRIAAALLCAIMLACALVSCDDKVNIDIGASDTTEAQTASELQNPIDDHVNSQSSTNSGTSVKPIANSIVTADMWKTAFDFSKLKSFTLSVSETDKEGADVLERKGAVTYNDGMQRVERSESKNGVELNSAKVYSQATPTSIISEHISLWRLIYELKTKDDLGYSDFTFSKETLSYSAEIDIDDDPTTVNIQFESGKITRISSESDVTEYGKRHECSYTYQFSYPIIADPIIISEMEKSSVLSKARADIQNASECRSYGILSNESDDTILYVIKHFVSNMNIGEVTHLEFRDGEVFSLQYKCPETVLEFMSDSIEYDSVTMTFDGGRLEKIELDYYYFYLKYYNYGTSEDTAPVPMPEETEPPETEKEEEKIFLYEIQYAGMSPTLKVGDIGEFERVKPTELKVGDVILFEATDSRGNLYNTVRRITEVYEYATHFEFQAKYDTGYEPYYIDIHQDQILGRYTGTKF